MGAGLHLRRRADRRPQGRRRRLLAAQDSARARLDGRQQALVVRRPTAGRRARCLAGAATADRPRPCPLPTGRRPRRRPPRAGCRACAGPRPRPRVAGCPAAWLAIPARDDRICGGPPGIHRAPRWRRASRPCVSHCPTSAPGRAAGPDECLGRETAIRPFSSDQRRPDAGVAQGVSGTSRRATLRPMGASVTLDHDHLLVDPGGEVQDQRHGRATRGTVVDQYRPRGAGRRAGWATIEPASLSLFPGRRLGHLLIRPPGSGRPGRVHWRSASGPPGRPRRARRLRKRRSRLAGCDETSAEVGPRRRTADFGASHDVPRRRPGQRARRGGRSRGRTRTRSSSRRARRRHRRGPGSSGITRLRVRPTNGSGGARPGPAVAVSVEPVNGQPITLEGRVPAARCCPRRSSRH